MFPTINKQHGAQVERGGGGGRAEGNLSLETKPNRLHHPTLLDKVMKAQKTKFNNETNHNHTPLHAPNESRAQGLLPRIGSQKRKLFRNPRDGRHLVYYTRGTMPYLTVATILYSVTLRNKLVRHDNK